MMSVNTTPPIGPGLFDRLSIKVLLLFLAAFILVFALAAVYDVFAWSVENAVLESNLPADPAAVEIDPRIETELAKVLSEKAFEDAEVVRDPFIDRAGISGLLPVTASTTGPQFVSGVSRGGAVVRNPDGTIASVQNIPGRTVTSGNAGATVAEAPPKPTTRDRLARWQSNQAFGQAYLPESTLFAIEDLIPVGFVDGGDTEKEVMFYSQAADRTLSFPAGTRFFDGWLLEIRGEGVVFRYNDENRTIRLKSWGRSIRNRNSQTVSTMTWIDQESESQALINQRLGNRKNVSGGSN